MRFERNSDAKWRAYQRRLRRDRRLSVLAGRLPRVAAIGCIAAAAAVALYLVLLLVPLPFGGGDRRPVEQAVETPDEPKVSIPDVLPALLAGVNFNDPQNLEAVPFQLDGNPYLVRTTIDSDLQSYVLRLLQRSNAVQAAAVVVRPRDGHVLAMASYDESGLTENLCLRADYPAASIFKIVAAAAAMEKAGIEPNAPMRYEGGRYTLYRRQLRESVGRQANETDFRRAFALSINPVFGRVGIYDLGREGLSAYADLFLFKSPIPFDIPLMPSSIEIPDHDFGLAEVASGFNKTTLISPLHAALISCAVVNDGVIMTPRLVDSVVDGQGETVHESEALPLTSVVAPETAEGLRLLMRETVLTGTGRSSLLKLTRSNIYKGIEVGAKTGSINDSSGQFRLDWVTAYAIPEDGRDPIAVAVLGVHGAFMGARAGELARLIMARHFSS